MNSNANKAIIVINTIGVAFSVNIIAQAGGDYSRLTLGIVLLALNGLLLYNSLTRK